MFIIFFFFFSSRRRHTRSYGDWSSDVCSSDLDPAESLRDPHRSAQLGFVGGAREQRGRGGEKQGSADRHERHDSREQPKVRRERIGKEAGHKSGGAQPHRPGFTYSLYDGAETERAHY